MVKRKIKQDLLAKENELKMNLSNNYKDLARQALQDYRTAVEAYHSSGELKEKDYNKYYFKVQEYTNRMVGYHH